MGNVADGTPAQGIWEPGQPADVSHSTMSGNPSTPAATYHAYAQRAARGQLASSAAAALAAAVARTPTEMSRRALHATLGKALDAAA